MFLIVAALLCWLFAYIFIQLFGVGMLLIVIGLVLAGMVITAVQEALMDNTDWNE